MAKKIAISDKSEFTVAKDLANGAYYPFTIDGVNYMSVKGYLASLKFDPADRVGSIRRKAAISATGHSAEMLRKQGSREWVWLTDGRQIKAGSEEHKLLVKAALKAKFTQNETARQALLKSAEFELVVDDKSPEAIEGRMGTKGFLETLFSLRFEIANRATA